MTCRRLFSLILIFSIVEGSTLIFAPEVNGVKASGVSANSFFEHSLINNQPSIARVDDLANKESDVAKFKIKSQQMSGSLNQKMLVGDLRDTQDQYLTSDVKFVQADHIHMINSVTINNAKGTRISDYDQMMMNAANKHGIDWRLLSAIGYCESRFKADIYSKKGAIGLMQVMPATAKIFGFTEMEALDPEINIEIATKMIRRLEKAMKISHLPDKDRLPLILASYNGGIGHVTDARRLAKKYGADPNKWDDVSRFLKLKADQKYASDDVVKCGRFRSGQTISFVDQVLSNYSNYCSKFKRS